MHVAGSEVRYAEAPVVTEGKTAVREHSAQSLLDFFGSVMATGDEDAAAPEPEPPKARLRGALCSHCKTRGQHELVSVGSLRASEYQCGECSGRTCMCANFAVCNGAAAVNLLWDEALCVSCTGAVERFSSGDLTLEGMVQELKEPRLQESAGQEKQDSPAPDAWDVLAHLLLPPGVAGSTPLKRSKKRDKPHCAAPGCHAPTPADDTVLETGERSRLSRSLVQNADTAQRTVSLSPVQTQRPASRQRLAHAAAAPNFYKTPSETVADAPEEAHASRERNEEALVETAKALKAAMQVTSPVTHVPEEVVAGARTTDLEPWEYMREALLSWPGPERANVDKYRAMLCHPAWIKRWLKACGGDVTWAMQRVLTHLEWRQEFKVDTIMSEDWTEYDKRLEMYPSGICKAGRPTWTWNVSKHGYVANGIAPNDTPEMGARYLVLTLERTWAMNPAAPRFNTICNCHDMGFSNYEHQMCLLCLDILSEHYPDNMEVCWLFPVTWVMSACVAVCRPMVSDETYAKHKILQEEEARETLAAAFDTEELEPMFGGTLDVNMSLSRNYLLENPAALRAWQEEEELALQCFSPGGQALDLQRRVLAQRGADAALASAAYARPGLSGYGEPFGPCKRIWRVQAPPLQGDAQASRSEAACAPALPNSTDGDGRSARPLLTGDDGPLDDRVPLRKTPMAAGSNPDGVEAHLRALQSVHRRREQAEKGSPDVEGGRGKEEEETMHCTVVLERDERSTLLAAVPHRPTRLAAPPSLPHRPTDDATCAPGARHSHRTSQEDASSGGCAATAGGAVVADGNRVNWAVIAAKCGNGMLGIIVTVVRTAVSTMMQMLVGVKEGGAAASDGASTREKAKKRD